MGKHIPTDCNFRLITNQEGDLSSCTLASLVYCTFIIFCLHFEKFITTVTEMIVFYRADPLSNMLLSFSTKEEAIAFAEKNGMYSI